MEKLTESFKGRKWMKNKKEFVKKNGLLPGCSERVELLQTVQQLNYFLKSFRKNHTFWIFLLQSSWVQPFPSSTILISRLVVVLALRSPVTY